MVVFLSSFCGSVVDFCVSASLLGLSVRFCTCPLRMKSVSYGLHALLSISPTGFQSQLFWGTRLPRVGPLGLGSLMWALDLLLLGEDLQDCDIPSIGGLSAGGVGPDCTAFLPLLSSSVWFLLCLQLWGIFSAHSHR